MKKIILFILLIGFSQMKTLGQTANDSLQISSSKVDTLNSAENNSGKSIARPENSPIKIQESKGDIKCYKNGDLLIYSDYKDIFKDNQQALHQIRLANFDYKLGECFGYIGGFVFGFCLGSAISGEKVDESWAWTLVTSAAVVGMGLIIYNSGKSHHRKAIVLYNSSLKSISYKEPEILKVGFTNSGIGLTYKF